ncbi:hypothetical protein [Legionella sp.]|uniref:hypothetical protein n=1 Tax=Legionella sp. TaxID=459 RepID=UPI003C9372C8
MSIDTMYFFFCRTNWATLTAMDRILVFDNGQIIEDGTHEKLMRLDGYYAKMWRMQACGFLPEYLNEQRDN